MTRYKGNLIVSTIIAVSVLLVLLAWMPPNIEIERHFEKNRTSTDPTNEIVFQFKNVGFGILRINKLTASCGCTSGRVPNFVLPFATANMHLRIVDPFYYRDKTVSWVMMTNAGVIQGDVKLGKLTKGNFEKTRILVNDIYTGELPKCITLELGSVPHGLPIITKWSNINDHSLRILAVRETNGIVNADLEVTKGVSIGPFQNSLEIWQDEPSRMIASINVSGRILSDKLEVNPSILIFSQNGDAASVRIKSINDGGSKVSIRSIEFIPDKIARYFLLSRTSSSSFDVSLLAQEVSGVPDKYVKINLESSSIKIPILNPIH